MEFFNKLSKHNYKKNKTENNVIQFQDVKSIYKGNGIFIGKYLHVVFPGISKSDSEEFQRELSINVHKSFMGFLKTFNGLILFSGTFSIYGFGRIKIDNIYQASRDPDFPLPYHLYDENNGKIIFDNLKIGSCCEDGLYLDNSSGIVKRIDKKGNEVEIWEKIDKCIDDLFDRFENHYDENGICKDSVIINNLFFNRVKSV